jgi:hypothetical protein
VEDILADQKLLATIFVGTGAAPYSGPSSPNRTPARLLQRDDSLVRSE